ncbi:hypothetical protein FRC01_007087, partial [Tulasnella sp. 417]
MGSSSTDSVSGGINKFTPPLAQASSGTVVLTRDAAQVFNFQSNAVTYTIGNPSKYNWNYATADGPQIACRLPIHDLVPSDQASRHPAEFNRLGFNDRLLISKSQ